MTIMRTEQLRCGRQRSSDRLGGNLDSSPIEFEYWIDRFQEEMDDDPDVYNLFGEKIRSEISLGQEALCDL